jgi:serine/threonine-protein kinase
MIALVTDPLAVCYDPLQRTEDDIRQAQERRDSFAMIGRTIGHYEVLDELGAGGMGVVYRARDTRLGREVAVKLLPEEMARDKRSLERFEREARAASALNHPNIVTLHSIEEADGVHFLTMELVEGQSLDQLIPQSGLSLETFFAIATPLGDALAAAHDRGITHRDLKPANIMVTAEGRVKVLDFGLAKLAESASASDIGDLPTELVTQEGLVVGTVPYMSPEQIEGRPVDHRTDVFSLGVVLYEMATGERPFRGDSSPALMSSILRDTPSPVTEVRPELPRHLGRVIQRCLEKDPSSRYQSALDIRNELESLQKESPSGDKAAGSSLPASGGTVTRRRPGRGVAAALALFAVFAAVWLWQARLRTAPLTPDLAPRSGPESEARRIVVLPFENLGSPDDDYFATGMSEEIMSRLGAVRGLGVVSRKSAARYAATDKTTREIGEELGVGYILGGSVRWARSGEGPSRVRITPHLTRVADDTQLWAESYDEVIDDIFEVQSSIAGKVVEQLGITLSEGERLSLTARPTENLDAYTLYLKGRHFWYRRTRENVQKGLEYFQQAVELDPAYALAHVGIADTWIFRGWYSVLAPEDTFPQAKDAALRALELDDTLAEAHTSLAHIYLEFDHDWEAAEREYRRAIELDPRYPLAHHWYGGYLSAMGRHEEALEQAEKARELDPLNLIVNTWVGLRHHFAGRYEAAIEEYQKVLELGPDFPPLHWHLGWALEQVERYEEAIAAAQKAIEASDGNPLFLASLGHAHAIAGNEKEAREILDELDRVSATRHVSAYHTAVIHGALGDLEEGFRWLDRAFEERSPWIGYLRVDPRVDGFRSDPRFAALLAKARLDSSG